MSKDKKIRIAFIGCGGNARGHGRRVSDQPDAEIVGLNDVNKDAIKRFREDAKLDASVPGFSNYKEMLKEVKPDAVVISTPHTLHFDQIMDSLDAGCHVHTEKPMVCTVEHALKVAEKVKETGKHLMISYQRHFQPAYMYCREVVQSGKYGKVNFVTAHQCQNWYKSQQGKWRQVMSLSGGGQLNDSGSHLLDILLWILEATPKEVYAMMEYYDAEVDILSALTIKFDNEALCNISVVGHAVGGMHEDFTIWMEEGTLFVRDGKIYIETKDERMRPVTADELPEGGEKDRAFLDLIQGKGENKVDISNGIRVIQLSEAAWKSADTGKPVKVES
ncbi:gfo/Idh/MocA family oxidoreductase [Candidatus Poribacteria bacterium]|nr:gfo/Idh/MocA family oxidoreductase [Candidatus Poribacteria bacterium]